MVLFGILKRLCLDDFIFLPLLLLLIHYSVFMWQLLFIRAFYFSTEKFDTIFDTIKNFDTIKKFDTILTQF